MPESLAQHALWGGILLVLVALITAAVCAAKGKEEVAQTILQGTGGLILVTIIAVWLNW